MQDSYLLETIKNLTRHFTWWSIESYYALLKLNSSDIMEENSNFHLSFVLLEKIYEYAQIVDYLETEELDELISLTNENNLIKLEKAIQIALTCRKYVNEIEENEMITIHPICKYYDNKDFLFATESSFYETLEKYIDISDEKEQDYLYDTLDLIDKESIYDYEKYFNDTIKLEIKLALEQATEEEILFFLGNYVFEKEIREDGSYEPVSELKSRIMMYLNHNYFNHSEEENSLYDDLEYLYLKNKYYLNNCKELSKKIYKM